MRNKHLLVGALSTVAAAVIPTLKSRAVEVEGDLEIDFRELEMSTIQQNQELQETWMSLRKLGGVKEPKIPPTPRPEVRRKRITALLEPLLEAGLISPVEYDHTHHLSLKELNKYVTRLLRQRS